MARPRLTRLPSGNLLVVYPGRFERTFYVYKAPHYRTAGSRLVWRGYEILKAIPSYDMPMRVRYSNLDWKLLSLIRRLEHS